MEEKIRIQDDLYEHVNGEWLKTAVIPADRPTTGGFSIIDQETEKTMMADFELFAKGEKTSDITGMKDAVKLYKMVMDTDRRDREGIEPLRGLLNEIKEIKDPEDLNAKAADLLFRGARLPFRCGVDSDMKDALTNSFYVLGPAIILPDTLYYEQEESKALLKIFEDMASKALAYTDLSSEEQKEYLEDTFKYDELISKRVKSQLEWADYVNNYNPMSLEEVYELMKPFDFKRLLSDIYGDKLSDTVIVYDPRAIKEMSLCFNEDNFSLYVHWAYVRTLLDKAAYLSSDLKAISSIYRRALTGVSEDPSLEKQAYQMASGYYSEPIGVYYGRTYFGEEAKKDITEIVKKVIETYIRRVGENEFLLDSTKEKAILKLKAIAIKMGYPDEVRGLYKSLKIDESLSYYTNIENLIRLLNRDEFDKLLRPVDRNEWLMPGHMVNACYDPQRNDITFPAAILQKPFYALSQTYSENLGGIGAVIGHEISHAFDNNGAHFDENGNLADWWSREDYAAFEKLTKDMIRQWDGIPYHGSTVNGELVVSENIADDGGMAVTLDIMAHTPDADYEKYFINWARIWCMKAKEEYIQLLLKNDVHSPAKLRANMPPRNFPEWYATFGVKETDKMYIAPEDRIIIW